MGRSTRDIFNLYHDLQELKIDLISVSDPSLNTIGAMGRVLLGILSVFSEFERSLIKGRMESGKLYKWERKKILVGSVPYGYKRERNEKGEIMIDPENSKIYQKIVDYYLVDRYSTKKIALELSRSGIQTPSASKGKKGQQGVITHNWDSKSILFSLKSPAYLGSMEYNTLERKFVDGGKKGRYMRATGKVKEDADPIIEKFEPLIDQARWDQIQNRIQSQRKQNRRLNPDHPPLLGNYVYCGECGSKMSHITRINKDTGKVYRWLRCYNRSNGTLTRELRGKDQCILKGQSAERIENRVYGAVIDTLTNLKQYSADWLSSLDSKSIGEDIKTLNDRISVLEREWDSGFLYIRSLTDEDLKDLALKRQKSLESDLEELRQSLRAKESELDNALNKGSRLKELSELLSGKWAKLKGKASLEKFLVNLSFDEKKKLIDGMVSSEAGGKIVVRYHRAWEIREVCDDPDEIMVNEDCDIKCEFQLSPDRISKIIEGFDKTDIIVPKGFTLE